MAITKTYYATSSSANSVADSDYIVVQQGTGATTGALGEMKKATVQALRQPLIDKISAASLPTAGVTGSFIEKVSQSSGAVSVTVTPFVTGILNTGSQPVAPSAEAVRNYVQDEIDTTVASRISSAISALDVTSQGGAGSYIRAISEENGKIVATPQTFDTSIGDSSNNNNAPTSLAVKSHVASEINKLDATVGNTGVLVQSVTETDGKLTSVGTVSLEKDGVSDNNGAVPTSHSVKVLVGTLTGSVGSTGTLVKSITETSGAITGTTIDITTSISNEDNKIPTAGAVYRQNQTAIYNALGALDYNAGATGSYIKEISQEDGKISASLAAFDTSITANTGNAPTTKAIKDYVDVASSNLRQAINNLNYNTSEASTSGTFLRWVSQTTGHLNSSSVAFQDTAIATGSSSAAPASSPTYSSVTDTAPNVKVVADQVKRLDQRADAIHAEVTGLNYHTSVADGKYISGLTQSTGKISASLSDLATTATLGVTKAITSEAVRSAINALDVDLTGSDGHYLKTIKEDDGKITATKQKFDTYTANGGWKNESSAITVDDNNAPTSLAVKNYVDETKRQILEESEAMTYMGAVDGIIAMASIASKASRASSAHLYNAGDTYVANKDFNLNGGTGITGAPEYQVYSGDMIIVNTDFDGALSPQTVKNFDIIGGSDKTVLYEPASKAKAGNFLAFAGTTGTQVDGRLIYDSGENADTIATRVSQSASYAFISASWAACSASSAIWASSQAQPYVDEASDAACNAASSARVSSSQATFSSSQATFSSSQATFSSSQATYSASQAGYSASQAKYSSSQATYSASQAGYSSGQATYSASQAGYSASQATYSASQAGYSASQAGYSASQATYSASQAGFAANQAGGAEQSAIRAEGQRASAASAASKAEWFQGKSSSSATFSSSQATYSASQAGYSASQAGYSASQAGYSASQATYSASQAGYSASQAGYSASQAKYSSSQATYSASQAGYSASQAGYSASQAGYSASQAGYASDCAVAASNFTTQANLNGIKTAAACSASYASSSASRSSSSAAVATTAVSTAIAALSYSGTGDASQTITSLSQTNGKISATWSDIAINENQVTNLTTDLGKKVDKEDGKGLSTNDFTTDLKNKLNGIESNAQVNIIETVKVNGTALTPDDKAVNVIVPSIPGIRVTDSETGNVVSGVSASGHELTLSRISALTGIGYTTSGSGGFVSGVSASGNSVTVTYSNNLSVNAITASSGIVANSFTANSSRKVKENIQPTLISALDVIDKVKVVDFNYIADNEKTPHIGFIAEDTPSILSTPHLNGMDYTNCIGTLLKAVQEITKGMEKLEKRIDELK